MYLYNLTLQPPTAITKCIYGNFSEKKAQEILISRGRTLELLRPDENGKVQCILSTEVFGTIRSIVPFRLTGGTEDYIVVGSDSGRIVILKYNPTKNCFDKIHQETFGKSGCRRIVPGQYLAVDPKGRAIMIGAVEKQKLVYVLNRDSSAQLTISSPLEAHKGHTIIFDIVGVDVGFENPIFAAIELDYQGVDSDSTGEAARSAQKNLTFYELDLGLNHVVRKWTDPIDPTASLLITVPGGNDGPGGVLVCCENVIYFKNQGHPEVKSFFPRRRDLPDDRALLIISAATHKQKDLFFFLVQNELGDLFKVTLTYHNSVVSEVKINYFDTVPLANSMCVLRTGFLFLAAEFGNHVLYQFQGIGEDEEEKRETIRMEIKEELVEIKVFETRPLKNLLPIDKIDSLSPIIDFKVADLMHKDNPQMYALCGRSNISTMRILMHGLHVTECAVSEMPGYPNAVWTVKGNRKDEYDKYIVMSFANATLVFSIGERIVEVSDKDSGFLHNTTTICASGIGEDSLLQVHPGGIRHVRSDMRIHEWKTPGKKTIVHAAVNNRQVVIALTGGELFYFELDQSEQLIEIDKKELGRDIACLDIQPIPEGRTRARFLAVGDWDNTVRIFSLEMDDCFQQLSMQALSTQPESLCIANLKGQGTDKSGVGTLFLNIGLKGVLLRTVLDPITGELSDTRTRFLGSRPVKLFRVKVQEQTAILALSSRPWLLYNFQSRFQLTPLSYGSLEHAANFQSEQCPEGIVAFSGTVLRIISTERLGEKFNQVSIPLTFTPRQFIVHPATNQLIIIETDHNPQLKVKNFSNQVAIKKEKTENEDQNHDHSNNNDMVVEVNGRSEEKRREKKDAITEDGDTEMTDGVKEEEFSEGGPDTTIYVNAETIPGGVGRWASCIRILDVNTSKTVHLLELDDNEAAFSLCTCVFHDREGEVFIVVGTAKDLKLHPRSCTTGYIHVYRLVDNNSRLQLLHKTPVDDIPSALCAFQGRLLVGVGKILRIYDLGKKKLLRKCENKCFPTLIRGIQTQGDRIVIDDLAESFHFVKYKKAENQLFIFADDTTPRWTTSSIMLDYDTIAGADKFGNIFVLRLPSEVSEEIEDDPTGSRMKWEQGILNGAPHKLEQMIEFYTGETVTKVVKASLVQGGMEAIIYTTIMGSIGALLPFTSREDVDFFSHLEMHMRQENPPLCGRDHLAFRSYYQPVKNVIDGDLCEQYSTLDLEQQQRIADELDRKPGEVLKKLEDIRNRLL